MRLRKRRSTLPRGGCTQEQIDAGCMWRSDLKRCQCPAPSQLTTGTTPTSEDKVGSIVIFPKTLQTRTVMRRYTKRRPGDY